MTYVGVRRANGRKSGCEGDCAGEKRGILLTSKVSGYTDKTLFLPAAGYKIGETKDDEDYHGHYWSSSLFTSYPRTAYHMFFDSDNVNPQDVYDRPSGFSVRPIR